MSDEFEKAPSPKPSPKPAEAGILKEKDEKDLEGRIVDTMRKLGSKLTRKEIVSLASRIEVTQGLDALRKSLANEPKVSKDLPDEVLEEVIKLVREAREIVESGLKELRLDIGKTHVDAEYEIDKAAYLSSRFPFVKKLEESELWKNVIIDIEGFLVGSLDSVASVVKLLIALIGDLILLPKHAYEHFTSKNKNG